MEGRYVVCVVQIAAMALIDCNVKLNVTVLYIQAHCCSKWAEWKTLSGL